MPSVRVLILILIVLLGGQPRTVFGQLVIPESVAPVQNANPHNAQQLSQPDDNSAGPNPNPELTDRRTVEKSKPRTASDGAATSANRALSESMKRQRGRQKSSEVPDAINTTASVVEKSMTGVAATAAAAGKYSGNVQGVAAAKKVFGTTGTVLGGVATSAAVAAAAQKEGLPGARRELEQAAADKLPELAGSAAGKMIGGAAAGEIGGPVAGLVYAGTKALLEHTETGQQIEKRRDEMYIHALGIDKTPERKGSTGPEAMMPKLTEQAMEHAGLYENTTKLLGESATNTTIGAGGGASRSNLSLKSALQGTNLDKDVASLTPKGTSSERTEADVRIWDQREAQRQAELARQRETQYQAALAREKEIRELEQWDKDYHERLRQQHQDRIDRIADQQAEADWRARVAGQAAARQASPAMQPSYGNPSYSSSSSTASSPASSATCADYTVNGVVHRGSKSKDGCHWSWDDSRPTSPSSSSASSASSSSSSSK